MAPRQFSFTFFEAYQEKYEQGDVGIALVDFTNILKMFSAEELFGMCEPLLEVYEQESDADYNLISKNISSHLHELYSVLQTLWKRP